MPAKPLKKQAGAAEDSRFKPGQSGNPSGKPRGTRSRATIFGEKILQDDADAIVQAVVTAAKGGDPTAMRLCIERLMPVRRGRPIIFPLPKLKTSADVGDAIASIATSMADGVLTPDEANAVAAVVELRRKAIESTELEKRIAALEETRNDA